MTQCLVSCQTLRWLKLQESLEQIDSLLRSPRDQAAKVLAGVSMQSSTLNLGLQAMGCNGTQLIIPLDRAKGFTATYGILHNLPHRPIVRRSQNPDDLV